LSDFELRVREEKKAREKQKAVPQIKVKYAEDDLAEWQAEAVDVQNKLKAAAEGLATDNKSLQRCYDQPLTLLVKQTLGTPMWIFPQALRQGDETLRETVERAISRTVGDKLEFQILGNAPIAFYHYRYPLALQESTGTQGAKVFYFNVRCAGGEVNLNKEIGLDYQWATYEELMNTLPKPIAKAVKPAIWVPPEVDFTQLLDTLSNENEFREQTMVKSN